MRHFQIYQLPIVIQRSRTINDQIRSPFLDRERRRVPRPLVISVRQSPVNQKRDDSFNLRRVPNTWRRDGNHRLRRNERRKNLHGLLMPRHEIKLKGSPLRSRTCQNGSALPQINLHRPATINQHPERRERLARHRLHFQTNHSHDKSAIRGSAVSKSQQLNHWSDLQVLSRRDI